MVVQAERRKSRQIEPLGLVAESCSARIDVNGPHEAVKAAGYVKCLYVIIRRVD